MNYIGRRFICDSGTYKIINQYIKRDIMVVNLWNVVSNSQGCSKFPVKVLEKKLIDGDSVWVPTFGPIKQLKNHELYRKKI